MIDKYSDFLKEIKRESEREGERPKDKRQKEGERNYKHKNWK